MSQIRSDETRASSGLGGQLDALDLSLFDAIESQSSPGDKRSLLACQVATRTLSPGYRYLEIGSYLGGSIQPFIVDPTCTQVVSIDKRPPKQPDNSGQTIRFQNNTTARMIANLQSLPGADLNKLTCVEGEVSNLVPQQTVNDPVQLCFIDGEHTDGAAIADYDFCAEAVGDRGAIIFHDAQIIYHALGAIVDSLSRSGRQFHAYNLPDVIFVIELGDFSLHRHHLIARMLVDNHVGYLASLKRNDHFRRWSNLEPLRTIRALKSRFDGTSSSA